MRGDVETASFVTEYRIQYGRQISFALQNGSLEHGIQEQAKQRQEPAAQMPKPLPIAVFGLCHRLLR